MPKLNLWEQAGKPTSFNPFTASQSTKLPLQNDYILTFRAKSPTSAVFRASSYSTVNDGTMDFTLTPEFKEYSFTWKETEDGSIYLSDKNGAGNIVIEDIRIVEKPLGRATINGIDGFQSGKWTLHPNSKVIDNETLEHTKSQATATEASILRFDCLPNTTYSFSNIGKGMYVEERGANNTSIGTALSNVNSGSFTTGPNTVMLQVTTYLSAALTGTYTYKQPMLNIGPVTAPYEPKRGERMVPPQPAKNLVRLSEVTITAPTTTSIVHDELVPTEVGKIYTISAIIPTGVVIQPRIGSTSIVYGANNLVGDGTRKSMTLVAVDTFITLRKFNSGVAGTFLITEIQVEENEFMTPFESYRVRTARKARKVPQKNMFNGFYEDGYLTSTVFNEKPNTSTQGQRTTGWMYCKPNTNYVASGGDRSSWHFKNAQGVITAGSATEAITTPSDAAFMRVYYSSNGAHDNIQIEEGTAPTAFESFRSRLRRATKLPKKNLIPDQTLPFPLWVYDSGVTKTIQSDGSILLKNPNVGYSAWTTPAKLGIVREKEYTLSCKVRADTPQRVTLEAGGVTYFDVTEEWKTVSRTATNSASFAIKPGDNTKIGEIYVKDIQIEEGPATSYEPYKLVSRPAPKGLEFDGIDDRIQVTAPLTGLSNKDFTIESTFKFNGANAGNHPQQTVLSCGDIRFGISLISSNQVGFYTPATGWVTGTVNPLTSLVRLKATVTPSKVIVQINDNPAIEKEYTGAINSSPQTMAHICSFGGSTYQFNGSVRSLKLITEGVTAIDFDFTKPQNNLGTKIKGNNGIEGTVFGNPYQLNRQARR